MPATRTLIVGMGVSGLSVARHLHRNKVDFDVADQRDALPETLLQSEAALSGVRFFGGELTSELLHGYEQLVVSPGIPTRTQAFNRARDHGVKIVGDVELFVKATTKPVLAITGSNGKSTVVSMAGEILNAADLRVAVVGNVGVACLDGLDDENVDIYVLELSSFQLELTQSLAAHCSCVLNVCEDHLDRYDGLEDYAAVKRGIYDGALNRVFNADDQRTWPPQHNRSGVSFSINDEKADWTLRSGALSGPDGLAIDSALLNVAGGHNQSNALAAMAITASILEHDTAQLQRIFSIGLSSFAGLPHRSELICSKNGVSWFNDSKGTNVGACVSALEGMDSSVVLIAGGRGKNADYAPMKRVVAEKCRAVVLIGEEAGKIHSAIGEGIPVYIEQTMRDAVGRATQLAQCGDCVLLSPACSSFDMFENFEARGAIFSQEVKKLCA